MNDGLPNDTHAHVEAEGEAEEIVHKHKRLERHMLLLTRLQVVGIDPVSDVKKATSRCSDHAGTLVAHN